MSNKYSNKRQKTVIEDKMSSNIEINDIFEELSNENKRLLNELLFANKCLKSLITFKTFVDFISHKFKCYLNPIECQKFMKLREDIEDLRQSTQLSDKTRNSSFRQKVVDSGNDRQKDNHLKHKLKNRTQRKENVSPKITLDSKDSDESTQSFGNNNSTKEVVKCQFCNQMFMSSNDHKRHLKVHTNSTVKPFVCYIPCGRSFSLLQDLRSHSSECHSDHFIRLETFKLNTQSIDSNPVDTKLKEYLKTNAPKISETVVNDKQINDISDNDSENGRQSEGLSIVCPVKGCNKSFDNYRRVNDHFSKVHKQTQNEIKSQRKRLNKITENVVNDNQNNDNSEHNSDDGRHSDDSEDNHSSDWSDSPHKQRKDSNSTQKGLKVMTNNRLIECPIEGCDQIFVGKIQRKHFITVHKESALKCSVDECNQTFDSYYEFLRHLWTHPSYADQKGGPISGVVKPFYKTEKRDGQTSYICLFENCGKRFPKYSGVYFHKRRFHKQIKQKKTPLLRPFYKTETTTDGHTIYICTIEGCGKRSDKYRNFNVHFDRVHKQKGIAFKCQIEGCGYECHSRFDLKYHKKTIHCKVNINSEAIPLKETIITCVWPECQHLSATVEEMKLHFSKVHSNDRKRKAYVCDYTDCGVTSIGLEAHKEHITGHKVHLVKSMQLKDNNKNKPSVDSNQVINQLKESLQTNNSKITENVVNDNRNNDESDDDSDDERNSDGFEDNGSEDSDYTPPKTMSSVEKEDHNTNDRSDSHFKQQNSTQISPKSKTKNRLIECPINGCNQTFVERLSRQHLMIVHKDSDLNCSVDGCNQTFESYHEFIEHLWTHPLYSNQLRPGIKCRDAEPSAKRFNQKRNVDQHYRKVHKQKQNDFKCLNKTSETVVNDKQNNDNSDDDRLVIQTNDSEDSDYIPPKTTSGDEDDDNCSSDSSDSEFNQRNDSNSSQMDSKVMANNRLIDCPIRGCGEIFVGKIQIKHFKSVHKDSDLNCCVDGCNQTFKSYEEFRTHLWTHPLYADQKRGPISGVVKPFYKTEKREGQTYYNCLFENCGKSFDNYTSVYKHNRNVHKSGKSGRTAFANTFFKTEIKDGKKTIVCPVEECGKSFNRYHNASDHFRKIHKPKEFVFKCQFQRCDYECKSRYDLVNHKWTIHRTEDIHLEEELLSQSVAASHKEKYKKPIECTWPGCEHLSKTYDLMRTHFKENHRNGRKGRVYVCDYNNCGVVSIGSEAHNEHIRTHKDFFYRCDWVGCEYKSKSSKVVKAHSKIHTNPEPMVCDVCKKEFVSKSGFLNHKKNVHKKVAKRFKCSVEGCAKTFKHETGLKQHHYMRHINHPKRFKCDIEGCSSAFSFKCQLKVHRDYTHCERLFACVWPGCEYRGKNRFALKEHEFIHKPEVSRYVCEWPECGKTLRHKWNYVYHMRAHKNDMRYSCEWPGCEFRTVTHWGIAAHRKTHKT